MEHPLTKTCAFDTAHLMVREWHTAEREHDLDLVHIVAGLLTEVTTDPLPDRWRGDFSVERAGRWIEERDSESPTLLVLDQRSRQPVGLLILFESEVGGGTVDLRIGCVIAESAWGRGIATELVAGLVDWARSHPQVRTLTGGVAADNVASRRVLVKNGFLEVGPSPGGDAIYELRTTDHAAAHGCWPATW